MECQSPIHAVLIRDQLQNNPIMVCRDQEVRCNICAIHAGFGGYTCCQHPTHKLNNSPVLFEPDGLPICQTCFTNHKIWLNLQINLACSAKPIFVCAECSRLDYGGYCRDNLPRCNSCLSQIEYKLRHNLIKSRASPKNQTLRKNILVLSKKIKK